MADFGTGLQTVIANSHPLGPDALRATPPRARVAAMKDLALPVVQRAGDGLGRLRGDETFTDGSAVGYFFLHDLP